MNHCGRPGINVTIIIITKTKNKEKKGKERIMRRTSLAFKFGSPAGATVVLSRLLKQQ